MSENTTTTPEQTAEEGSSNASELPEAGEETTEATEEVGKPGAEAAKYRRRLRETEAERDSLSTALDTYRRRDAEQVAEAAGLANGGDLFDAGNQLGDLLADDGTIDVEKVKAAAAEVLARRPHWGAPTPSLDLGPRGRPEARGPSWGDVLKAE